MIRKRIIAVITVRNGLAVQSFGYGRYLPMGSAAVLAVNFNRWGADEIVIQCIDRSRAGLGPDLALLEHVASMGLSTPIVYGGGIRNAEDARQVIGHGADRLICDALLHRNLDAALHVGDAIGTQAVIANLSLAVIDGETRWYDYVERRSVPISDGLRAAIRGGAFSELMVSDWQHEGYALGFDLTLIDAVGDDTPQILFGGISDPVQAAGLLARDHVAAVAIGNFLSYREHAVQYFREGIAAAGARDLTRPVDYRDRSEPLYVG